MSEPLKEDILFLEHFGVKGMHWGVRSSKVSGVSSKTNKDAKKDAEEFARAKLFYGDGAGTRRKLIKATVEAKSKKDPSYAKAFESHFQNQDLSTHASKARTERKRTDNKTKRKQRAGFIARKLSGEQGTQAAIVAVTISGAAFLKSQNGQKLMRNVASKVSNFQNDRRARATADFLSSYFARNS